MAVLLVALAGAATAWADGIDASYPQCGIVLPGAEFTIIGVNGGRPFAPTNPCLVAQVAAAGTGLSFYANTANPGPVLSAFWPFNATAPRPCATAALPDPDTPECAFDYGYNAANDSYDKAVAAQVAAGQIPAGSTTTAAPAEWWLDVEVGGLTGNTWRDPARNVEVLAGAVAALEARGAGRVGFYSSAAAWQSVTGGTQRFSGYATWQAGAGLQSAAPGLCAEPGLTGGGTALVQYRLTTPAGELDGDTRCPVRLTLTAIPAPELVAGAVPTPLTTALGVVQGQPTAVTVGSNLPGAEFGPSAAGPWASTATIVIPPRTRTAPVFGRATIAGRGRVHASAALTGDAAPLVVGVRPGRVVRLTPLRGPGRVRVGRSIRLRTAGSDAFGNRTNAGLTWRARRPGIVQIVARADGSALVRGRRRGTTRITVRGGVAQPRRITITVR